MNKSSFVRIILCVVLVYISLNTAYAQSSCDSGSLVFREDFGGNEVSDPPTKGSGIPQCVEYTYNDVPLDYTGDTGLYAILKQGTVHSEWYRPSDHTHPDDITRGYFMQVDASKKLCTFYYVQVDDICEGAHLRVSMWGMSSSRELRFADAYLKMVAKDVDGNVLSVNPIVMHNGEGIWKEYAMEIDVPIGVTSIIYSIENNSTERAGNDFCLDDIEIRMCTPQPTITSDKDDLCLGETATIASTFVNNGNYAEPLTYTWMKSSEKSYDKASWTPIISSESSTLDVTPTTEGKSYYRVMVTGNGQSTDFDICNPFSEILEIKTQLCEHDTVIKETICEGDLYHKNGFNESAEGFYYRTTQTTRGGDSTIMLQLTVLPTYHPVIEASICAGETYTENGFNETEAGTYTQELKSKGGCDSVVTLHLTVLEAYRPVIEASICAGETYAENGFNETEAGTYTQELKSKNGCDSIVTLHLTVLEAYRPVIEASICAGETYTENGFNASTAGTYTQELKSRGGCDSIVTLELTVLEAYHPVIEASICAGETYTENGFNETEAGTYTRELKSRGGCDSVVTLHLTVLPSYQTEIKDTVCQGSKYNKYEFYIPEVTEDESWHSNNLISASGCDSIISLYLVALPLNYIEELFTIKSGDSIVYNNVTYKEAGIFQQYNQSRDFCESINITIEMKEDPGLVIPSEYLAITEGKHDIWKILNIENYKNNVKIFDRMGKLLYEINDYSDTVGWDGNYNGHPMPSTDYWYLISLPELDKILRGHFTLFRFEYK